VLHAVARGDNDYRKQFQPAFHAFGLTGACLMIVLSAVLGASFFTALILESRPVVTGVVFFQCIAQFFLSMALGVLIFMNDAVDTNLGQFKNGTLTVDFLAIFFGVTVTAIYVYRALKRYATEHK
jgi:hypothetical protein